MLATNTTYFNKVFVCNKYLKRSPYQTHGDDGDDDDDVKNDDDDDVKDVDDDDIDANVW